MIGSCELLTSTTRTIPARRVHETTFFADAKLNQNNSATTHILRQSAGSVEPLTFSGLIGKKIQDGYSIQTFRKFFFVKAIDKGALQLQGGTQKLLATLAERRDTVKHGIFSGRSYKHEIGNVSYREILSAMTGKTGTNDRCNTAWQLNWVEVTDEKLSQERSFSFSFMRATEQAWTLEYG